MKKTMIKVLSMVLVLCTVLSAFASCNKKKPHDDSKNAISNEDTPLVIASEALDGVFNPFFYTSGADGSVIGLTQIGMLNTDKNGNLVCGYGEDCVALDYSVITFGSEEQYKISGDYNDYYTKYTFALKNGIKFSNGASLTGADVLFNLYTLLDPSYTGSSTLYSTNIKGLKAYRAQTYNENEQEAMDSTFTAQAVARINELVAWCDNEAAKIEDMTERQKQIVAKAETLFREELTSDWASADSSKDSYEKYGFKETWEVFLYMEGLITVKVEKIQNADGTYTTKYYPPEYNDTDKLDHSKEAMINTVYESKMGKTVLSSYKTNLKSIVAGGWATAGNLRDYFKSICISDYFKNLETLKVPNVSGITLTSGNTIPSDNNGGTKTLSETCEILEIIVNGVDPKAIYNFSFTVTPMSYYSTEEEIQKFSVKDNHFGVAFADAAFFEQMQLKQVPVGAGPYKATTPNTDCAEEGKVPAKNDFFRDNIVYYERNNNFYTVFGNDPANPKTEEQLKEENPKIRKVRYKVISSDQMFNAVAGSNPEVYYSEPQATNNNMTNINNATGIGYAKADNLGYGYIGINAKYVKEIEVRRAIMYCLDTSLCLEYYGGLASSLYRSMSSNSWAYPSGCLPYYAEKSYECTYNDEGKVIAIGKFDEKLAQKSAREEVTSIGYSMGEDGKMRNAKGDTLTFTFTVAGDSTDHPAWRTMAKAADLLNAIGFDVTVTKDANALSKLSSGTLAVWAAAWSSTIDPDMYQVYHKDSSATSIRNWGFPYIMEEGTDEENELLDRLAELIEDGRATIDQEARKGIYSDALDLVMELAVECATYQRQNLFIWNSNVIDSNTVCEATAYQSPLSKIWKVSFVQG